MGHYPPCTTYLKVWRFKKASFEYIWRRSKDDIKGPHSPQLDPGYLCLWKIPSCPPPHPAAQLYWHCFPFLLLFSAFFLSHHATPLPLAAFHGLNAEDHSHWRHTQLFLIMLQKVSTQYACFTTWLALNFRPVLVCTKLRWFSRPSSPLTSSRGGIWILRIPVLDLTKGIEA